jgi:hypothetical protein
MTDALRDGLPRLDKLLSAVRVITMADLTDQANLALSWTDVPTRRAHPRSSE